MPRVVEVRQQQLPEINIPKEIGWKILTNEMLQHFSGFESVDADRGTLKTHSKILDKCWAGILDGGNVPCETIYVVEKREPFSASIAIVKQKANPWNNYRTWTVVGNDNELEGIINRNIVHKLQTYKASALDKESTYSAISQEISHNKVYSAVKSDIDELPAVRATKNKNAYAVVIRIENYRQKLPKANFATNDAKTVFEYLTKVMGYPEENVVMLLNENALKSDFEKYFGKWLSNNVEKDSTVFIYYSGHGAPNPKTGDSFLVPYDGDPSFINETGYPLNKLFEHLGKLPVKQTIVALDSCFSGAGGRSVTAKGARPLVMNISSSVIPSNLAFLSASSGEQISTTYDEKGHGLFTYFMLKGLKGEAEINGKVDIEDLFEYLKPHVERIARKQYNNEQTPQLIGLIRIRLR